MSKDRGVCEGKGNIGGNVKGKGAGAGVGEGAGVGMV